MRRLIAVCLSILLFLSVFSVFAMAEDITFTTKGGTWSRVNENTYIMDTDGDGITDVTLVKNGSEWEYRFVVPDPNAQYYVWEEDVPDDYTLESKGSRQNPLILNEKHVKYSHTPNVSDAGVQSGNCSAWQDVSDVVTIPGATSLKVTIKHGVYNTTTYPYWVCLWEGDHADYKPSTNFSSSVTGKLSCAVNSSKAVTQTFTIPGDSVTIGFRTQGYGSGFGYHATVEGFGEGLNKNDPIVNKKDVPELKTGGFVLEKRTVDAGGNDLASDVRFGFDISLSAYDSSCEKYLSGTYSFGDLVFTDGHSSVYLKNGDSASVSGLPVGLGFDIDESLTVGWDDPIVETERTYGSGPIEIPDGYGWVVEDGTMYHIVFTNKKQPDETPDLEYTSLRVVKKGAEQVTPGDVFKFNVLFWDLPENMTYRYRLGDEEYTFEADSSGVTDIVVELGFDSDVEFMNIPANVGVKYQVLEAACDYVAGYDVSNSVVVDSKVNIEKNQDLATMKLPLQAGDAPVLLFTNKGEPVPDPEKLNISVRKEWNDNENANGLRPESITVYLTDNGNVIASALLDEHNSWSAVFRDLDKFRPDGVTLCDYVLSEVFVPGYRCEITKESDVSYVIVNSAIDTGDLLVTKQLFDLDKIQNSEAFSYGVDLDFKFDVSITKDGKPVSGVFDFDSSVGSKSGSIVFDEMGQAEFSLKQGESVCISDLPSGAEYEIAEVEHKDFVPRGDRIVVGTIKTNEISQVNYVNEADVGPKLEMPDTGGIGVWLLMVLGVSFVLVGFIYFVKIRRNS